MLQKFRSKSHFLEIEMLQVSAMSMTLLVIYVMSSALLADLTKCHVQVWSCWSETRRSWIAKQGESKCTGSRCGSTCRGEAKKTVKSTQGSIRNGSVCSIPIFHVCGRQCYCFVVWLGSVSRLLKWKNEMLP